jgi:uncharacterized cofD-like protein
MNAMGAEAFGGTGRRTEPWPARAGRAPRPLRPLSRLRVVAIGGGTGLPLVLAGLKRALFSAGAHDDDDPARLTAVVTVADDGGSTGRLRRAYGIPAPGDVRNCLLALSDGEAALKTLFGFRFGGNGDLGGHSLGNLILTALSLAEGDFQRAIERASALLAVRGRVLPASPASVSLVAELHSGARVWGESTVARYGPSIRRLGLRPHDAPLATEVREAIGAADLVVLGPGSLYTSLLPPLLVHGMGEAVAQSRARVVLVMNAMTEPGESDGLTAAQHLAVLRRHVRHLPVHDVLLNTSPIAEGVLARYAATNAGAVHHDTRALEEAGCRVLLRGLLADADKVRHDPRALAAALLESVWSAAPAPAPAGRPSGAY